MKKAISILTVLVLVTAGVYFLFPKGLFELSVQAARTFAGLSRKEIRIDDHRIVYLEGGRGPTILLLHGFGANKDNWLGFARYLTDDYHVVVPDIPGFGESSQVPTAYYSAENQLKRLDRFLEVLKLERFHVAGNSMGGMLAAMYGAKYPRKVSSLALLAPGGVGSPHPSEASLLFEKGINPLLIGNPEDFDRLIRLCFFNPPFIPSQFKKVLAADAIAHRDFNQKMWNDLLGDLAEGAVTSRANLLKPYLSAIRAPVLILWGDSDQILDVGGVSVLEKGLQNAQTVVMKETGHTPMLEKPKETAFHYITFLNRQE